MCLINFVDVLFQMVSAQFIFSETRGIKRLMDCIENSSLKAFNTFGIDAQCRLLLKIESVEELRKEIKSLNHPYFILGGGSNLLISKDQTQTFLKNEIKGKVLVSTEEKEVFVRVGGGENWHDFVLWSIAEGYGGIENLSFIPGTVGASPIQNIGAYGVELEQVFHSLEAVDMLSGEVVFFDKEECLFGYRDSTFKNELKGMYFITHVTFCLSRAGHHNINRAYGAINQQLDSMDIEQPTVKNISDAVIAIRQSKLPDPLVIGNSGSFFKNPIISEADFKILKIKFPTVPSYPASESMIKVPAGWLIDQAGWKGKRIGDAGCYEKQALVLVNHGNASGADILNLAKDIIKDVQQKFGITLSPEVNVI